jgi:hypothetical protein
MVLLSVVLAAAMSTSSPEAVRELANTTRVRDKQIDRQVRMIETEQRKRTLRRNRVHRRHKDEAESLWREVKALGQLRYYLKEEQETIRRIAAIDEAGRAESMRGHAVSRIREFDVAAEALATNEAEATQRYAASSRDGRAERNLLASMAREVTTWRDARAAFERERALYERLLIATGTGTLDEIRVSSAKAQERINEQYRQTDRRYVSGGGSDGDALGKLIIAIGLTAAVAAVLSNPDATTEEKSNAQRQLDVARTNARANCAARGGHFFEGGGTNVGVCSE